MIEYPRDRKARHLQLGKIGANRAADVVHPRRRSCPWGFGGMGLSTAQEVPGVGYQSHHQPDTAPNSTAVTLQNVSNNSHRISRRAFRVLTVIISRRTIQMRIMEYSYLEIFICPVLGMPLRPLRL